MTLPTIRTERLTLTVFTPDAIDALLAGNALRLNAITASAFPQPLAPPPLMEDMLPDLRDRLRKDPSQIGWWSWVVTRRDTGQAIGSVGLGGPPNEEGTVIIGLRDVSRLRGEGLRQRGSTGADGVGAAAARRGASGGDHSPVERQVDADRGADRDAADRNDVG